LFYSTLISKIKNMKILVITPGSGDHYYCENCLRDHANVKALIGLGNDVIQVPLYLPPKMIETGKSSKSPLFFGGVNVYLQQKFSLFRKTPRWIDRIFDSKRILEFARKKASTTRSSDIGPTMLSMLKGEDGRQAKEIKRLKDWILKEGRPDWIILNNILLIGLARCLRSELDCKVACMLQDEDTYLDSLEPPFKESAWNLVREKSKEPDLLVAVSHYYKGVMKKRLKLSDQDIRVIYPGIDLKGFEPADPPDAPTIGFLSRMCEEKGLDLLVEAFIKIKQNYKNAKLKITGGNNTDDEPFINAIKHRMKEAAVLEDAEFQSSFERSERQKFLSSLSVLSVPERHGEAWGLYTLEAMAAGIPVVQAANGVANELLEKTKGGVLFQQNDADALVVKLSELLSEPEKARAMGAKGRENVIRHFDVNRTAKILAETLQEYK